MGTMSPLLPLLHEQYIPRRMQRLLNRVSPVVASNLLLRIVVLLLGTMTMTMSQV
jgi:hypothetical protein